MTLKGRYLPPASCRVSSCLAARCDECDFTKVAPSQVADSQFACSLKLELQVALLRMCQSSPFTYACNSARSPATEVRFVLCARRGGCMRVASGRGRPRRPRKAAASRNSETAENGVTVVTPSGFGFNTVVHRSIGCFGFCAVSERIPRMDEGNACTRVPPRFAAPSGSSQH